MILPAQSRYVPFQYYGYRSLMRCSLVLALFFLLTIVSTVAKAQESADSDSTNMAVSTPANAPLLPIPPVTEIAPTGDVDDVVAYYEAHEQELIALFGDASRARALFAMYTVHIAIPYGESTPAVTLEQYVTLERAHCGIYTPVQQQISEALGLETRMMHFTNGWHGWVEVNIDGQWEIFDSTTNTWIDRPMGAMLRGYARQYEFYYTPVLDESAPDIFRAHLQEGPRPGYYSTPSLRERMPFFGLEPDVQYPPLARLCVTCDGARQPLRDEHILTRD